MVVVIVATIANNTRSAGARATALRQVTCYLTPSGCLHRFAHVTGDLMRRSMKVTLTKITEIKHNGRMYCRGYVKKLEVDNF